MKPLVIILSNRAQHYATQHLRHRLSRLTCLILSFLLPLATLGQTNTAAPAPLPSKAQAAIERGMIAVKQADWNVAILCLAKRSYTSEINDLAQTLIRSLPLKFLP